MKKTNEPLLEELIEELNTDMEELKSANSDKDMKEMILNIITNAEFIRDQLIFIMEDNQRS